jgi:ABC-type multidrug transport system ATPase subunit
MMDTIVAVDEISFEVQEGEIFGMVGPNGAGKTTTIECLEGLRKPDRRIRARRVREWRSRHMEGGVSDRSPDAQLGAVIQNVQIPD